MTRHHDNDNQPKLFSCEEAAGMLSISTKTLREFVRAGEIAYIPLGRGKTKPRLGFHIDDINDFIKGRRTRECLSINPKTVHITTLTSGSEGIGFVARRKLRIAEKQNLKKS